MQIDIQCKECKRITRNYELGEIFYSHVDPTTYVLIKNSIICPKCNENISNKKCMIKKNEFLISIVTAQILVSIGEFKEHLAGVYLIKKEDFKKIEPLCKSQPIFLNSFLKKDQLT